MGESATTTPQSRTWFQFTTVQVFAGMAVCGVFFALVAWTGWMGAFLFMLLCGFALLFRGIDKRDLRYLGPATLLIAVSASFMSLGWTVALGVGSTTQAVILKVVDASGKPIKGASVCMREVDLIELPVDTPIESPSMINAYDPPVITSSNTSGMASLSYTYTTTSRMGYFVDEWHLMISPALWIQIDAPGYQRHSFRLETIIGRAYDGYELPFPTIEVQLEASEP